MGNKQVLAETQTPVGTPLISTEKLAIEMQFIIRFTHFAEKPSCCIAFSIKHHSILSKREGVVGEICRDIRSMGERWMRKYLLSCPECCKSETQFEVE